MNYHLVARPIPITGESPASVLIRAVEGNGYPNLQSMVWAYFKNASGKGWARAAHTDPGRYMQIMEEFGITVPDGQLPCFSRSGPTSKSPLALEVQDFHNKVFRDDARYYCPECLRERGYWRKAWSLRPFSVCPEHKVYLLKDCPECGATLHSWRGKISKCECGADLTKMESQPADIAALQWWLSYHGQSKQAGNLVDNLFIGVSEVDGNDTTPRDENRRLEAVQHWLETSTVAPWLLELINQRAVMLHPRVQLLPLLRSNLPPILSMASAILSQCEVITSPSEPREDCWMSYQDAQLALGISRAHFNHFMKHKLLAFRDGRLPKKGQVSRTAISGLLNMLQKAPAEDSPKANRPPNSSLASMIVSVMEGHHQAAGYDLVAGLASLKFSKASTPPHTDALAPDWMCLNEIAEKLGTYSEAVRFLCHKGMLEFRDRDQRGKKRLSAYRNIVDEFNKEYVLAGTFASQIQENPTNIAEKLMALGLQAVSGPSIDGTLVYLFRRDEIEKVDASALREMKGYATKAGRKSKQVESTEVSPDDLTANEVADQLNIRVHQVRSLIRQGVLARSDKQSRLLHVSKQSVQNLKQQLDSPEYILLKEAANRLNQSSSSFQKQWVDSGLVSTLELGLWRKVSILEVEKLEDLLSKHVTAKDAGKIFDMHRSHFPNLERRGLVHSIMAGTKRPIRLYSKSDIGNLLKDNSVQ